MAAWPASDGGASASAGALVTYNVQAAGGGYLGWKILQRTQENQRTALENSAEIRRSRDYFVENAMTAEGAEDFVSDYRLLNVALKAFGLEADVNNRIFIRKVIEADAEDKSSLVNRLSDKRYFAFNQAISQLNSGDAAKEKSGLQEIVDLYHARSFERNLGQRYPELEIALNAQRELAQVAGKPSTDNTKWYGIISSKPLRKLFEGAFGFGNTLASLPVERQVQESQKRLRRLTGRSDVAQFSDKSHVDAVIRQYLLRSGASTETGANRFSAALMLLRGGTS